MGARSNYIVNVLELRYSLNDWPILLGQTLFTANGVSPTKSRRSTNNGFMELWRIKFQTIARTVRISLPITFRSLSKEFTSKA